MELTYKIDEVEEQRQHDYEMLLEEVCEEFKINESFAPKILCKMAYSDEDFIFRHRIGYVRSLVDSYYKRFK